MENKSKLLSKLDKLVQLDYSQALEQGALVVENDAKIRCPVDDGLLRMSITHQIDELTATVGSNQEYSKFVEIGTGLFSSMGNGRQDRWSYQTADGEWHSTIGQHPQPFLKPALDNNKQQVIEQITKNLKKQVDDLCKQ